MRHRRILLVALLLLTSLILASCGGAAPANNTAAPAADPTEPAAEEPAAEEPTEAPAEEEPVAEEPTEAPAEEEPAEEEETSEEGGEDTAGTMDYSQIGEELAAAWNGEYEGTSVSVSHGLSGDEEQLFAATFVPFEEATGIDVVPVPGGTVETINVKVQSGTIEDIVNFPQPGGMAGYAREGLIVDLNEFINEEWLTTNYNQGFIDTLTVEDENGESMLGGVFERINFKSAVWYPKAAFDEAGYEVPTTWEEQQALMDQIVADGDAPWCIGIESGGASGWPATDWLEDIMLRTTSLENYDAWATGELPFTSPEVRNAVEIMSEIWFNDDYVYGGSNSIASTGFGDAPTPMFDDPPSCWLHRQGNFITSFFETNVPGVEAGVDYDFYYLPPIDPEYGNPVLYAGDLFSMFNDRPEVRALMQYFTTYEAIEPWIEQGQGALSPHQNADLDDYNSDIERRMAETILSATSVRFDASDLMPAEVGSGSFWAGMTDYVSGAADLEAALETMQAGWANVPE